MNVVFTSDIGLISKKKKKKPSKMFERDLILAIWESLVIFPSFDTFFLILELATQFIFKARSKPENL